MASEPRDSNGVNAYAAPQADRLPDAPLPGTVVATGWVSLLTDTATEMAYPLLPTFFVGTLGASKAMLGVVEGVAETTAAFTRLPAGVISDRIGRRKPLMMLGYGVAGLVRPFLGVVFAPWQALLVRFADRFGKGIRGAPRDALITDVTTPAMRGRAFGFHRAMDHVGAAIGPLLAFAFLWFRPEDYRTLFLLTLIPGLVVLIVLWRGVKEPRRARDQSPPAEPGAFSETAPAGCARTPQRAFPTDPWTQTVRGPFAWFLGAVVLFTLGRASELLLLLRIESLGVQAVYLTLLWSAYNLTKSAVSVAGGWLSDQHPQHTLLAGWGAHVAIYVAFALATTAWQALVLFMLYAVYFGLSEPAERVLVSRWARDKKRGTAFGWYHLAVGIATLPASAIFGWLWDASEWGASLPFTVGAALGVMAMLVLLKATR
jgi:sugar phosphate permease